MKMKALFKRPKALTKAEFPFCAGCQHGNVHRLIAEVIDELKIQRKTIAVYSVGCSVFGYRLFAVDGTLSAHGKAPAEATGIKSRMPNCVVFTYQGDGDLASIGIGPIIQAAKRGDSITVIFVNNATFGMTGGQMAPTTLLGQKTTTTPEGREALLDGNPIDVCKVLNALDGPTYIARVALVTPKHNNFAKKAIKKAFQIQIDKRGFSIVEVLSACPVGWGLKPPESLDWIKEKMIPKFPLGEFRTPDEGGGADA